MANLLQLRLDQLGIERVEIGIPTEGYMIVYGKNKVPNLTQENLIEYYRINNAIDT